MALVLEDAFLPATLTAPPMTDEEFLAFCGEHPDLFFEMSAEGELIVMPPPRSLTGARSMRILTQLGVWTERNGKGIAGDPAMGFVLPNGARRSPDGSWTPKSEIAKLSPESRDGYWHLCPAFVIELRLDTDRLPTIRAKMREYMENGAKLGWLIDPSRKTVEIYRPGAEPDIRRDADRVEGEGPMAGFTLDLRTVWDPLGA
jgi:Uma2 family endonuclease